MSSNVRKRSALCVLGSVMTFEIIACATLWALALKKVKHDDDWDSVWDASVLAAICHVVASAIALGFAVWIWCREASKEKDTAKVLLKLYTLIFLGAIGGVCIGGVFLLVKVTQWTHISQSEGGVSHQRMRHRLIYAMLCCGLLPCFTATYSFFVCLVSGLVTDNDITSDPFGH
ncbi:unnamed protein product [Cuscuta epithymum]|uniref:Transmembrane protein n=1 Tax=Cuscuta epithymum TaxID=186058 RepID=A0AAV0DSJ9_9ASTE|nr:unnamed protein product [Cuscuta epithymum]